MEEPAVYEVEGKLVRFTSLSKEFFPEDGITKAEVISYYLTVAKYILPHIAGRPLTLKAFPHGIHGRPYYRRRLASTAPKWLSSIELPDGNAPVVENTADLMWVANQDSIEIHPWLSRGNNLERPDLVVFDLDPGPKVPFERTCEAATVVKLALEKLDVRSIAKTSGGKGIHVVAAIEPRYDFEDVHTWVIAIARVLSQTNPKMFTMDYTQSRRTERILIDHNQVGFGRTTASIYSLRPIPGAPVSTPLTWKEVEDARVTPGTFTIRTVPARLQELGDIASELQVIRQTLPGI